MCFRFPLEHVKRTHWIELLGFPPDKSIPKEAQICSEHFTTSDFQVRSSGRILTHFAQPRPFQPQVDDTPHNVLHDKQNVASTSKNICAEIQQM